MKNYIRSIDAPWDKEQFIICNPSSTDGFRKVVNNKEEYFVLFDSLDDLDGWFHGETWVYWSENSITVLNTEQASIIVYDHNQCNFISFNEDYCLKDHQGTIISINHPITKHNQIILFYNKSEPMHSKTLLTTDPEFYFYLNYLKKFDI